MGSSTNNWLVLEAWIGSWAATAALLACDVEVAAYCARGAWECTLPDGAYTGGVLPAVDDAGFGPANDATMSDAPSSDSTVACELTQGPGSSSCAVDEAHGVFVAPAAAGGSDATGTGTRAAPFASIGHALDLAKASGKRVYVCEGTYVEAVVIDGAHDGVGLYGGLDCARWTYATAHRVVVAPASSGFALEIANLTTGATVADVEFDAQDANPTQAGESSVAAFVHGAQNVSLQRVTLLAGKASDGEAGVSAGSGGPTNWTTMPLQGTDATSTAPGAATVCQCALHGSSSGGGGGAAPLDADGGAALDGGSGLPDYDDDGGSAGANGALCALLGTGGSGEGAPAAPSDIPTASSGSVSAAGWSPATGASGGFGTPGQGGGGGGAGPETTGFGGGGACGGCGGAGGGGGGGGGGSIALLVYDSSLALSSCTLTPFIAGSGGPGGRGEPGQPGGIGGGGGARGCQGGAGGYGSGGNGGQGGPGGVSLGVAFSGTAPAIDGQMAVSGARMNGIAVSPLVASGGLGGAGGGATVGGSVVEVGGAAGASGAPGTSGVSQAILGF
jgi:hypothetical protein